MNRCVLAIEGVADMDPLHRLPSRLNSIVFGTDPDTDMTPGDFPRLQQMDVSVAASASGDPPSSHRMGTQEAARTHDVHAEGVQYVRSWPAARNRQSSPVSTLAILCPGRAQSVPLNPSAASNPLTPSEPCVRR